MDKLVSRLRLFFRFIINSIGFYPTLLSVLFFGFAVLMVYFETRGLSSRLQEKLPYIIITHGETATMILSSIAAGIFSLIVFSFTMVMLVLNQASANFTPRVIPGLISSKSNQKVLGLFLGTLIYSLVVMVNIRSELYEVHLPGVAVFLAMCFTFLCLACFVYFIHSISLTIQIGNILEGIYDTTLKRLRYEIKKDEGATIPEAFQRSEEWQELFSTSTGYLQQVEIKSTLKLCQQYDIALEFLQPLGYFIIKGAPFARISKQLDQEKIFIKKLFSYLSFHQEELTDINYLFGFKQITESAIKALSPGINDPGTAVKAIDYLTDLFVVRMQLTDEKVYNDKEGTARLRLDHETFSELLFKSISPIRLYAKENTTIMLRLLYLLKHLYGAAEVHKNRKPTLEREVRLVLVDADESIKNLGDREKINDMLKEIHDWDTGNPKFPLLAC